MSRKRICDPGFVYTPMPEEQRQRLSDAHRARLGIPKGYHRIYGVLVPEDLFPEVSRRVYAIVRKGRTPPEDRLFLVRIILVMVEEGR